MSLKKIGDWDRVEGLIGNIGKEMLEARDLSLKRVGLKAEKIAVTHLSKQDLPWKALSPAYLANKIRRGFSENILIRSSSYFQAITSWVKGDTAYAGVKTGTTYTNSEGLMEDVARVHEYGSESAGIPARPLWEPTFDETLKWHQKENMPEQIFLKNVKRKYGV